MNTNTDKNSYSNPDTLAIVFDLDGTLINTAPDVCLALNAMLAQYQLPPIKSEEIYELIGLGAISMIERAFGKFGVPISPQLIIDAKAFYLNYYRSHPAVDSFVYPNVKCTLDLLQQQGMCLGICTNKPSIMANLVLEEFELKHYFKAIVGGDDIKQPKPHGQHIHDVLNIMGCSGSNAIMVGDSDVDQTSAANAGIQFIGVTYGYFKGTLNAHVLINHFHELPTVIHNLQSSGKLS